jgi:hypothetical protein
MTCTIKKGSHYCSGWSLGLLHTGTTIMAHNVVFDTNCLILPGDDTCDRDINKLFGWSYGMHQTNSIRVGWRSERGAIHLFAYMYMNGTRVTKGIGWTPAGTSVPVTAYHDTLLGEVVFIVGGFTVGAGSTVRITWTGCAPCMGYNLRPYFGGNCSAPADMTIKLD